MGKTIYAYCSYVDVWRNNKILSAEHCKKFPGQSWITSFIDLATENGDEVLTGDICLSKISQGELVASDVVVIADIHSEFAESLVKKGAKPGIVLCYESPLFAEKFYENLVENCDPYGSAILFSGLIESKFPDRDKFIPNYYPSFSNDDLLAEIIPWEERGELVMVVSNKYYRHPFPAHFPFKTKDLEAWFRGKFRISSSPVKRYAMKEQLHNKRLEAIKFFAEQELLDLYGNSWESIANLPLKWRKRMGDTIAKLSPNPCDDKKQTIAQYKFSLCFENNVYPGYVTEKIIDCLVAGVIPIYLGAPDITEIIPADIFIDLRDYPSWSDLSSRIKTMGKSEGEDMIRLGQEFVRSESGQQFTYQSHAQKIWDLLTT